MASSLTNGMSTSLVDRFGTPMRNTQDPAWQPPRDPLGADARATAGIIRREIPISVVATGWDVRGVRAARQELVLGLFDLPAQMVDAMILTDARVQAGLASRLSIFGRPVKFTTPPQYRDSSLAKECKIAFRNAWPSMATEPVMSELQRWAVMLGVGFAQNLWDFSGPYAIPHPLPWHPRYVYFDWLYRCYIAITLDGIEPIVPGDASWILHAPHGEYRGWMRGAAFSMSPWWLGRSYALRDWMRYSERHGLPMLKFKRPAVGDPYQGAFMRQQLANLGQEAVFDLPQNPPPALSYDIELLEAKDTAHEGFRMLIQQCSEEETLALMAQTLTTSMPAEGGSSYAAARVHAGVLQGLLEADARALSLTAYRCLARPFAEINFGNADLAPVPSWDVTPFEDAKTKAAAAMSLAETLNFLRLAGFRTNPRDARRLFKRTIPGFDIGRLEAIEPLQLQVAIEGGAVRGGSTRSHQRQGGGSKKSDGGGGGKVSNKADLGRIARILSRLDPRAARLVAERARDGEAAFFDGNEDGVGAARKMAAETYE